MGWRAVFALAFVSLLTACTASSGRDFVRPARGSLVIGQTTESEVLARYGKPWSTGSQQRDGRMVDMIVYSYSSTEEAVVGGATPARVLVCHFVERGLVGYEFVSSYPVDHTSFDPGKRRDIEVGESTREDVIAMMGPPNGELARPLIDAPAERALVYSYSHTQVSVGFLEMDVHQGATVLQVLLGADGVVQDVKYSESRT
ncbi:MAG: hypothetical protein QNJ30_27150 [Kiloniellales bacterium]|nr:hypothetical protein [Kiloniellales bacterium]